MSPKPPPESPHRWLVVCGSPGAGFAFYGPFDSKGAASEFRDDWIAQGAESAELAWLHEPSCDEVRR